MKVVRQVIAIIPPFDILDLAMSASERELKIQLLVRTESESPLTSAVDRSCDKL